VKSITVVIPTVKGREHHLTRCMSAYDATYPNCELIIVRDKPACGIAWQIGADKSSGDYIHFTADDLAPHEGWAEAAIHGADQGTLPAPKIINGITGNEDELGPVRPDGFFTRIPFCSRAQWEKIGPMIPIHYYTDNWFSWRGFQEGYESVEATGYTFTHFWAQEGRGTPNQTESGRMAEDAEAYRRYKEEGYKV
jgi:hypothetical protein